MTVSPSPELAKGLREFADTLRVDYHYMTAQTCREREVQIRQAADALESTQAEIARLTTVSGDMVEEMARAIRAAIDASDHLAAGPRDVGEEYHGEQRTLLYVDGAFDLDGVVQAAAAIAAGRIARLTTALKEERGWLVAFEQCLNGDDYFQPDSTIEDLRASVSKIDAALKDSPE